jgi:hypothetical protein
VNDDAPYRRPGLGASPVLAQLAEVGSERRREMPRDAETMPWPARHKRLEAIFGVSGNDASGIGLFASFVWMMVVPICIPLTAADGNPVPVLLGVGAAVAATTWAVMASTRRAGQRAASVAAWLAWAERQPFPVRGFDLWCLSEWPLLDVALSAPVDRRQLADALAAVDSTAGLEWLDDRTVRISIPPRTVTRGEGATDWYADPTALVRLFERLLLPLHTDVPIERVDMGGAMHKR